MTTEIAMKHSPETLAQRLGLSTDAIRKKLKSMGLVEQFQKAEPLADRVQEELLSHYATKGRSEETRQAAGIILGGEAKVDIKAETEVKVEPKRRKKAKTIAKAKTYSFNQVLADVLLSFVTLVAMYVQIVHTKTVVALASPAAASTWSSDLQHWGYALAIQFTGLAMTLYNGKLIYLQIFAVAEFFINLFYFRPWSQTDNQIEAWILGIILSALISFTIYSYAEVYAARRRAKTEEV